MKAIAAIVGLYILVALAFVPLPGIHTDEAIFAEVIYRPQKAFYRIEAGPWTIPLLHMSYLGTLKAWVYAALLSWFPPTIWVVRVPMVLVAAGTIALLWASLRRAGQPLAAIAAAALLASDSVFLLTTTYDWGPVALQQLLIAGGMYCVVRRSTSGGNGWMITGGALFGLALWNKALAAWMLGGLALATAAVFARAALTLRWRAWVLFAAGAVAGAGPILAYNLSRPMGTIRENARWATTEEMMIKPRYLWDTLRGGRLREFLLYPGPREQQYHQSLVAPAAALSLAAVALFRHRHRRRLGIFVAVATAGAAIPMFPLADAGLAVHHAVLVWPLPHVMVALGIAELADGPRLRRWVAGVAATAILASNAAVLAEHYRDFRRYGFAAIWSDAVFTMARVAVSSRAREVYVDDWGMHDSLRLLTGGRYQFDSGTGSPWYARAQDMDADTTRRLLRAGGLHVSYVPELAIFPTNGTRLRQVAELDGRVETNLATVVDSHGRPVYRVYTFQDQNQSK